MTSTDETQTRSRVGPTISELYELYLGVMRRVGHYRWFSLFMKHVGLTARPGADPREPGPILHERSAADDDAAHDERQKTRQRSNGAAALRARWQESRRRLRELRARNSLQLAEEPARRPNGTHRDRRHRCKLSVATRYRG